MAFKNDFRPDIIAGNPPYNNGMDIDFVFNAFDIVRIAISMIVPGKWQTCEDDQRIDSKHSYGEFREKIVPHMDKVVFYPDAAEVFPIEQPDGITIYMIDKRRIFDKATVVNRNNHQELFNNSSVRNICNMESLNNLGNELVEYISNYTRFEFNESLINRYKVYTGGQVAWGYAWGYDDAKDPCSLLNRDGQCYAIGISNIIDSESDDNIKVPTDAKLIFSSSSLKECESFISWINTRFVRFFTLINIGKRTIVDNQGFRLVPAPIIEEECENAWNKIYTDDILYRDFNLYEESAKASNGVSFIDIINSVIKER